MTDKFEAPKTDPMASGNSLYPQPQNIALQMPVSGALPLQPQQQGWSQMSNPAFPVQTPSQGTNPMIPPVVTPEMMAQMLGMMQKMQQSQVETTSSEVSKTGQKAAGNLIYPQPQNTAFSMPVGGTLPLQPPQLGWPQVSNPALPVQTPSQMINPMVPQVGASETLVQMQAMMQQMQQMQEQLQLQMQMAQMYYNHQGLQPIGQFPYAAAIGGQQFTNPFGTQAVGAYPIMFPQPAPNNTVPLTYPNSLAPPSAAAKAPTPPTGVMNQNAIQNKTSTFASNSNDIYNPAPVIAARPVVKPPTKVNNANFMDDYMQEDPQQFGPPREVNVLLLGETGVGKSTFINAFASYLTYESLDEAQQHEIESVIKISFTITDENYKVRTISNGKDDNEANEAGQSSTQSVKAYLFPCEGNRLIRLIDTPGIGDVRGVEQDKKNMESILAYLNTITELHAICILLKPNESRITTMFRFCIKELLVHLHRSASTNILFCFTNARGTFYKPGETIQSLRKVLESNQEVVIELNKETIYCFDSESFRYLCAVKAGIKFDERANSDFAESWNRSVEEVKRMIERIDILKPHTVSDTVSVNYVRQTILKLRVPMAEISKNIADNIANLEDQKRQLVAHQDNKSQLEKNLKIQRTAVQAKPIDYPKTVCAGKDCVEMLPKIEEGGASQVVYKTICHDHCYLTGIEAETYPNPGLQSCACMDGSRTQCSRCGCSWQSHLHILYDLERVSEEVDDPAVVGLINASMSNAQKVQQGLKNIENEIERQRKEQSAIAKCAAKFGHFLKKNALAPINDAMVEYLELLIKQESEKLAISPKGVIRKQIQDKIDHLRKLVQEYEEEVQILSQTMSGPAQANFEINTSEIMAEIQHLYSLPINGKRLRQIMEVAKDANRKVIQYQDYNYNAAQIRQRQQLNRPKKGRFFFWR